MNSNPERFIRETYLGYHDMKIHLKTYGCTYNQADSDGMRNALLIAGHELVDENDAELVVLNTCAVKDATEQKELFRIKREKRPLVVTGCLAQANPSIITSANPNASIVGTFAQGRLLDAINSALGKNPVRYLDRSALLSNAAYASGALGRLKISKGCLSACSFCQTKHARGNLESFPISDLRRLCRDLLRQGALEIQLSSQDCGCFGFDDGKNLVDLLSALCSIEGDFRIRIGMGNPEHFRLFFDQLLDAMAHLFVYKFLHIPVQSGSDTVLMDMRRPYEAAIFSDLVARFKNRFPNGLVATDVIVGYPTETESDFEATLSLLEKNKPDMVNLSRFSPRPNTPAARLPLLPPSVVALRSKKTASLCDRITRENHACFVGKTLRVRALEFAKTGHVLGRSDDYRPVLLPPSPLGSWQHVRIESFGRGFLRGQPVGLC